MFEKLLAHDDTVRSCFILPAWAITESQGRSHGRSEWMATTDLSHRDRVERIDTSADPHTPVMYLGSKNNAVNHFIAGAASAAFETRVPQA